MNSSLSSHSLHSMCSYMAMFPPRIPDRFIKKYSNVGEYVLDPFCGRGTTPLQACFLDRIGIGNDLNPIAYSITRAKIKIPTLEQIMERLHDLEMKQNESQFSSCPKEIRQLFHNYTLKQLVFLKKNLEDNEVDNFIKACILGILHGNSSGYLSLRMPNTFSMSPNYIRKYVKEHELKKPKRDVFENLRKKIIRMYSYGIPSTQGMALNYDVRELNNYLDSESVRLIITSPPYLEVIRYGKLNWIRCWFLDYSYNDIDKKLINTSSEEKYLEFIKETFRSLYRLLEKNGIFVLIVGDVHNKNLASTIWKYVANNASTWEPLGIDYGFRKVGIITDEFNLSKKVSRIWKDKMGKATKVERYLIMQKLS
jgi:hypothetical protein